MRPAARRIDTPVGRAPSPALCLGGAEGAAAC